MERRKAGSEELAFLVSNRTAEGCAGIGGESFKMRDIRRTVETMLAGLGIRKDTRAQLLSHDIRGVQAAHYAGTPAPTRSAPHWWPGRHG